MSSVDDEPQLPLAETTHGPALRAAVLSVGCRHCHAAIGEPCVNKHLDPPQPVKRFLAHLDRINDAVPF